MNIIKSLSQRQAEERPDKIKICLPWLSSGTLTMLYAPRGVGKSQYAFNLAISIAQGTNWLDETCHRSKVLYIDGEMGASTFLSRLPEDLILDEITDNNLHMICPEDFKNCMIPSLGDPENYSWWIKQAEQYDLIIIDNYLTTCYPTFSKDSDLSLWNQAQKVLIRLREMQKAVIIVHHTSKGGVQYGSILKENIMDTILRLRQFPEQHLENGLTWEIKIEKDRHNYFKREYEFMMDVLFLNDRTVTKRQDLREARKNFINKKTQFGTTSLEIATVLGITTNEVKEIMYWAKKDVGPRQDPEGLDYIDYTTKEEEWI